MDVRARQVELLSQEVLRQVVQSVAFRVISETPVDTGQARTNWIASIGGESQRTVNTVGRSPQTAFRASVLPIVLAIKANDRVFIVNALDYIADLNRGKSPQAGPGYFQAAVNQGFREAVALVPAIAKASLVG